MPLETIHVVLAIGSIIVSAFLAVVGLKIKITATEINGKLDTHVATDEVKHGEINRHLEYTDGRVDRLENRQQQRH